MVCVAVAHRLTRGGRAKGEMARAVAEAHNARERVMFSKLVGHRMVDNTVLVGSRSDGHVFRPGVGGEAGVRVERSKIDMDGALVNCGPNGGASVFNGGPVGSNDEVPGRFEGSPDVAGLDEAELPVGLQVEDGMHGFAVGVLAIEGVAEIWGGRDFLDCRLAADSDV